MQKIKEYTKFKLYLDDRVRHYPFIHDMVVFYKGLLDIWSAYSPDDLSALFETSAALSPKGESERIHLLDTTRISELKLTSSINIAKDVFKLFETCMGGGKEIGCSGSSSDAVQEFISQGLLKEDKFKNALLKWILKPSFENTLKKLNLEISSGKGICPLCSSPPAMAIVFTPEDETYEQRLLSCCFCAYRWHYPMTGCPSCGNSSPERFGLIVGDSVRDQCVRAVSCEECKTYLKTVFTGCRSDKKRPDDLDMEIEDVATLNLDIMADQRGFTALCQR
ncbi:MAG: formate dehydrogenase accessory protein FdhE [Nitrospirae bacterium]|nr:formate dehydrogenase accessory protein FdhE [Nitrospirota bacterium]